MEQHTLNIAVFRTADDQRCELGLYRTNHSHSTSVSIASCDPDHEGHRQIIDALPDFAEILEAARQQYEQEAAEQQPDPDPAWQFEFHRLHNIIDEAAAANLRQVMYSVMVMQQKQRVRATKRGRRKE